MSLPIGNNHSRLKGKLNKKIRIRHSSSSHSLTASTRQFVWGSCWFSSQHIWEVLIRISIFVSRSLLISDETWTDEVLTEEAVEIDADWSLECRFNWWYIELGLAGNGKSFLTATDDGRQLIDGWDFVSTSGDWLAVTKSFNASKNSGVRHR